MNSNNIAEITTLATGMLRASKNALEHVRFEPHVAGRVLLIDEQDDDRTLCSLNADLLAALSKQQILVDVVSAIIAVAEQEREVGKRIGIASLQHQLRDLLVA